MSEESAIRSGRILAAIAEARQLPVERITLDSTFEELGIDSLDGFNLLYELEERFEVTISDEDAREIRDVRGLIATIERLLAEGGAGLSAGDGSPA